MALVFYLRSKIRSFLHRSKATARPSLLARFPVMLFVPPCCSTLCRWSVTKSCATCYTKRHARKNGPQSYIYIMQVIRSLFFSGFRLVVFRLPITGIMYFGLRQIATLPPRRDPWPKPQKNKAKVCKLCTGRPTVKKQGYINSRYCWLDFNGTGCPCFFPTLACRRELSFFPVFSLWKWLW